MLRDLRELAAEVGPWAAITLYACAWLWKHYLGADLRDQPAGTAAHDSGTQPGDSPPTCRPAIPRR